MTHVPAHFHSSIINQLIKSLSKQPVDRFFFQLSQRASRLLIHHIICLFIKVFSLLFATALVILLLDHYGGCVCLSGI